MEQSVIYIRSTYKVTHSRACRLLNCSRGNKYYQKRMPIKDEALKEIIKEVIGNSRKGRKKVISLVRRLHPHIGISKIRRVYHQQGFALMKRLKKRTRNNPPNPASIPLKLNEEWAIDFMHDSLVNGRQIRSLNIIDHYNRQCKGISIRHSFSGMSVIEQLERAIEQYGKPKFVRSDNGPEFISKKFQTWMHKNNIGWSPIEKGKPQQNCFIERFNKTVREDLFDANLLFSIDHANQLAQSLLKNITSEDRTNR